MKTSGIRSESLVVAALPLVGMLVVGVVALRQMMSINIDIRFFVIVLIIANVVVFVGELLLLRLLDLARTAQVMTLLAVCREYLAGNRAQRATATGDQALDQVASALNTLLDWVQSEAAQAANRRAERSAAPGLVGPGQVRATRSGGPVTPAAQGRAIRSGELVTPTTQGAASGSVASGELMQLDTQVQRLAREIGGVMDGDLRIRPTIPPAASASLPTRAAGSLRNWSSWSPGRATPVSRSRRPHRRWLTIPWSSPKRQKPISKISETTEIIEKLVAFMQRLNDTLQLNDDIAQKMRGYVREAQMPESLPVVQAGQQPATRRRQKAASLPNDLLTRMAADVERQSQLLEGISGASEERTAEAEAMVADLYDLAQRLHQLCSGLLRSVESINLLASLASQWGEVVMNFQLPEEARVQLSLASIGQIDLATAPMPTGSLTKLANCNSN